jgi:hypothetical protein
MTARRLSHLQKQILAWLLRDEQRTRGMISSSHPELVSALPAAKGNISHSLRLLETRGWIVIGRNPGWESGISVPHAGGSPAGDQTGGKS